MIASRPSRIGSNHSQLKHDSSKTFGQRESQVCEMGTAANRVRGDSKRNISGRPWAQLPAFRRFVLGWGSARYGLHGLVPDG